VFRIVPELSGTFSCCWRPALACHETRIRGRHTHPAQALSAPVHLNPPNPRRRSVTPAAIQMRAFAGGAIIAPGTPESCSARENLAVSSPARANHAPESGRTEESLSGRVESSPGVCARSGALSAKTQCVGVRSALGGQEFPVLVIDEYQDLGVPRHRMWWACSRRPTSELWPSVTRTSRALLEAVPRIAGAMLTLCL
jgi:hypothetical protein